MATLMKPLTPFFYFCQPQAFYDVFTHATVRKVKIVP